MCVGYRHILYQFIRRTLECRFGDLLKIKKYYIQQEHPQVILYILNITDYLAQFRFAVTHGPVAFLY